MDSKILVLFIKSLNPQLETIIISNSTNKDEISKIKIRPILLKQELVYQGSEFRKEKVFHSNYSKEDILEKLPQWFGGLFRQCEIKHKLFQGTILISKKGKTTVSVKSSTNQGAKSSIESQISEDESLSLEILSHNKKKNYILEEGTAFPFLVDLGVMTGEGRVVRSKFDKFKQINRFLEFIEDILPHLDKNRELTILDFGCGKSYLTFAMYYYLKVQKGYHINVIGLDLKEDVIEKCNGLSRKYGYDKLQFLQGDIASYTGSNKVDMVVTLHACDTATDYALAKAVSWGAEVILSVPCCQHELNKQIHNDVLEPILKYGILKERIAALITDGLRAELLETAGYRCQLLEFIDMEHTPKNILLRAVKKRITEEKQKQKTEKIEECISFLGVNPTLKHLLK